MKILLRKTFRGVAFRMLFLIIIAAGPIDFSWAMQNSSLGKALSLMKPGDGRRAKSHNHLGKLEQRVDALEQKERQWQENNRQNCMLSADVGELQRNFIMLAGRQEESQALVERNLSENLKNNEQRLFQQQLYACGMCIFLFCHLMWYAFPNKCGS